MSFTNWGYLKNVKGNYVIRTGLLLLMIIGAQLSLHSQDTFTSAKTGRWDSPGTWTGGTGYPGANDSVIIQSGHTISVFSTNNESAFTIRIQSGGVLDMGTGTINVGGKLIVDGNFTSSASSSGNLNFSGDTLGGNGNIALNYASSMLDISNSAVVLPAANLQIFGDINIQNGVVVTNQGLVSVYGDLDGADASGSVWTNDTNSELETDGILMNTGVLNASATGNTVSYLQSGNQSVKTPSSSTYYHLTISGTNTKTLTGDLIIAGDLLIENGTFDSDVYDLEIAGDWTNLGAFQANSGSVTFNGTSDQTIVNEAGEVFYDLILSKSSGSIYLEDNVQAFHALNLSLSAGIVEAGNNILTLGSGLASTGTLTHNAGYINGSFERWINSTGTHDFPVGSSSSEQAAEITLNGLQSGGTLITTFFDSDGGSLGLPLYDNPDSVFNEFVDGYWSIDEGNGFKLGNLNDYDISLDATGFTSFTIDNSTRVLIRSDGSSSWTVEGTHVTPVGSIVGRSGVKTLPGEYALGDTTNCARPVTSAITGTTAVCTGESTVLYSVTDNSPNTYTWIITGGTQASGGTTNSITVDWGSTGMANGNVRVIERNSCSNGVPVDLPVTIHSVPPSTISGRTAVAENTSGEAYSVTNTTGYTYTWTITGGTQVSGGTTNSITVDWGSEGTGYVSVVAQYGSCTAAPAVQIEVNKYVIIESVRTGRWDQTNTWDCSCVPLPAENVRINNGHTVQLWAATEITNLIIATGGALNPGNRTMTVHGDFVLNGTYLTGTQDLIMDGLNASLDGLGTLDHQIQMSSNVSIASTAVLDMTSGDFIVDDNVSVSNYGSLAIAENLVGNNASSTFINKANATLKVGADLFSGNGILNASATDNTVDYNGTAAQTIKTPASSYYNLITEESGTKSLSGNTDINGDLTINTPSVLDAVSGSNYSINLAGDWINLGGTFNEQQGNVILDGSSDQNITGAETFYDLTFSNSSDLYLNNNTVVSNTLSMSGGNILAQGNTLTVGTGIASPGSLSYTSGAVVGQYEKWITGSGPYLFPVGTATDYLPANLTFTSLVNGSVISEFISGDPGSTGLPLSESGYSITDQFTEGYWSLTAANSFSSSDYDVQLTATGFTSYSIESETRVIKRTSGGSWVLDGTHAAASSPDVYRNGLTGGISTSGSHFGLGHGCPSGSFATLVSDDADNIICAGDQVIFTAGGGTTYEFFVNAVSVQGPGASTTYTTTTLSDGDVVTVTVTDGNGCTDTHAGLTMTVETVDPPTILGPLTVCNSSTTTYTVTDPGSYTFLWSVTNGTIVGSDTNSTVDVLWSASGPGSVSVLITSGIGCSNSNSVVVNVNNIADTGEIQSSTSLTRR